MSRITRRRALSGFAAAMLTTTLTDRAADAAAEIVPIHASPARQPVSFKSGGQTCYGMMHAPGTSFGKPPGVLMLHGLVGSKDQPHRIFGTLGDALAEA